MAQQHTQAAGSGIDTGAVQALRNRAVTGLLINASTSAASAGYVGFSFWRGYIKALQDISTGAGGTLAQVDLHLGYEPPSHLKSAFAALAKSAESLTFAQVQQLLATQGVEVAADAVTNGQINAGQQLKDSEIKAVHLNDEHAPTAIDGNDGPLHDGSPLQATVAQKGGAS